MAAKDFHKRLLSSDDFAQYSLRATFSEYSEDEHSTVIDRISDVRVARMKQSSHLLFSNEPDISLRGPGDMPLLAVEVKAGSGPPGALERLGAAMKSFDNDKNVNPRVKTVYVVRSITPELQKRIAQNNPFDHTFGLSEFASSHVLSMHPPSLSNCS